MNNKSYILGLGSGMIICSLIVYVVMLITTPSTYESSVIDDQFVIERATELGMVMKSETEGETEVTEETVNPENENNVNEAVEDVTTENSEEDVPIEENKPETEIIENSETEVEEEQEQEQVETVITEPEPDFEEQNEEVSFISFTVEPGSSSYTVSNTLFNIGLIDDEIEFNQYLIDNGYNTKIRTGTFSVASNSSYEDIAKILVGR